MNKYFFYEPIIVTSIYTCKVTYTNSIAKVHMTKDGG